MQKKSLGGARMFCGQHTLAVLEMLTMQQSSKEGAQENALGYMV